MENFISTSEFDSILASSTFQDTNFDFLDNSYSSSSSTDYEISSSHLPTNDDNSLDEKMIDELASQLNVELTSYSQKSFPSSSLIFGKQKEFIQLFNNNISSLHILIGDLEGNYKGHVQYIIETLKTLITNSTNIFGSDKFDNWKIKTWDALNLIEQYIQDGGDIEKIKKIIEIISHNIQILSQPTNTIFFDHQIIADCPIEKIKMIQLKKLTQELEDKFIELSKATSNFYSSNNYELSNIKQRIDNIKSSFGMQKLRF